MAGALRKTMVYLGLAEEDERYDGYDVDDERRSGFPEADFDDEDDDAEDVDDASAPARTVGGREVERADDRRAAVTSISRPRLVSAKQELHRITTIHPRTYNEAKTIGESFRGGTPVIMNLTDMDDADAKRLVDFAAGLVFGLHGSIERVTNKVFLLSPAHVEVAAVEPTAPKERGLFNQS